MFRRGSRPRLRLLASPTGRRAGAVRWLGVGLLAAGVVGAAASQGLLPVDALVAGFQASMAVATPAARLDVAATEAAADGAAGTVGAAPGGSPAPAPAAARERAVGAESASAVEEVAPAEDTATPASEDRYAFLLLGYGGGRHEGSYLTDSLMLVIVDPAGMSLTLLSMPRDAWVPMSFDGKTTVYNKVNTAYAFARDAALYPDRLPRYRGVEGAGVFAAETVSRLLGVPVRYHAALDFAGFRQAIDAVGGVEVNVPTAFAARYPANDDPSIDPSWTTVRFRAGRQRMDGEAAIRYARARSVIDDSAEGGDFARTRRQRLIIEAFKDRLVQPTGLLQLPRLLKIATDHLETDYDIPGGAQFGELLLDWRGVEIHQAALTLENYLDEATGADGAYLLVPRLEDRSWAQVRAFTRRLWAEPKLGAAMARTPITVVNSTGTPGVAGQVADALARLGYRVEAPATGTPRARSRLTDRTGGEARDLARALAKDLGTELEVVAEDDASGADLVLEIGSEDARLAHLAPRRDAGAPRSRVGVRTFGRWEPEDAEPEPGAAPVVTRHAPATPRPATGGASPTAAASPAPGTRTPTAPPIGTGTAAAGTAVPSPAQTAADRTPTPAAARTGTRVGDRTRTPAPGRTTTPVRTTAPTGTAASTRAPGPAAAGTPVRAAASPTVAAFPTVTPARAQSSPTPTPARP